MAVQRSALPHLRMDSALFHSDHVDHHQLGPCLFVSRESGAGGGEIARRAAECLNWHLLDKEVLDQLSSQYGTSRLMLDAVDEKRVNWLADIFNGWIEGNGFSQLAYVRRLHRLFEGAASRGSLVIVGRGARFMLPRDIGFSVRIIAPLRERINRIVARRGVSPREARAYIERLDGERNDFLERYFHHDVTNPHEHDLVINTEHLGEEGSLSVLLTAMRSWLQSRTSATPAPGTSQITVSPALVTP